jgi:hypothetical protein
MSSVRSGRSIDSALQRKGFLRVSEGDHVHYYFLRRNGERSSIKTKMSHGMLGSTISVKLIGDMARQLHLTKRQFLDLIDCPLDEEGYRQILQDTDFDG